MKNSCPVMQKHGITARAWVLIFFTALALHLVLFFLFRPLPNDVAESGSNDRYTIFLTEKELTGMRNDPHALRYWLRYMDPERVLKPDPDSGFSMIGGKTKVSIPDPAGFSHLLFQFSSEAGFQAFPAVPERTLSDHIPGAGLPVLTDPASLQKTRPETAARHPIWTDEAGEVFSGLFYPDKNSFRILETQHSVKPTLLRLHLPQDGIPSVRILRSCGNAMLDALAVRQLKIRKENFIAGAGTQTKYFMVSWQPPDHNGILKGARP